MAVTASSYTSGVHWTFCHTARDRNREAWNRPGGRSEFQPLTIEHLMASSAIPFLFPSSVLWVDGRREFFGDGSMRQVSPLSPAMRLGAHKILVVGVGQPERSGFVGGTGNGATQPTMGGIAGHAMASVFRDTLQQLPREVAAVMPCAVWRCWRSSQRSRLTHWPHELPGSVRRAQGGQDAYARKEELLAFLNGSTA